MCRWNVVRKLFCAIFVDHANNLNDISRTTSRIDAVFASLHPPSNSTLEEILRFLKFNSLHTSNSTIYDSQNFGWVDEGPSFAPQIFSQQSAAHLRHPKGGPSLCYTRQSHRGLQYFWFWCFFSSNISGKCPYLSFWQQSDAGNAIFGAPSSKLVKVPLVGWWFTPGGALLVHFHDLKPCNGNGRGKKFWKSFFVLLGHRICQWLV